GYPIAVDYDVELKPLEGLLSINRAKVLVGKTPIDVAGSLTTNTTPAQLDLSIKTGDVSISEIARLASAFGVAFAPGTNVSGRIEADVKASGPASKPALKCRISDKDIKSTKKDKKRQTTVRDKYMIL